MPSFLKPFASFVQHLIQKSIRQNLKGIFIARILSLRFHRHGRLSPNIHLFLLFITVMNMCGFEEIQCVYFAHKKKIFFTLGFKKQIYLTCYRKLEIYDEENSRNIISCFIGCFGCICKRMLEMAFNTKINKALKSASFNEKTLADIRNLQSECKRQHDMGMSVS